MNSISKLPGNDIVVFAFSSNARAGLSSFATGRIVRKSWSHNLAQRISGILMYSDGKFQEIIEGSGREVQRLAARIIADNRHDNITVTRFESAEKRMFDNWRVIGFEPFLHDLPSDAMVGSEDLDKVIPVFFGQSRPG